MKPCGISPDCLHPVCAQCGRPVRASGHRLEDHPGTMSGRVTAGRCNKHWRARTPSLEERVSLANTLAGLERFMEARQTRARRRAGV